MKFSNKKNRIIGETLYIYDWEKDGDNVTFTLDMKILKNRNFFIFDIEISEFCPKIHQIIILPPRVIICSEFKFFTNSKISDKCSRFSFS